MTNRVNELYMIMDRCEKIRPGVSCSYWDTQLTEETGYLTGKSYYMINDLDGLLSERRLTWAKYGGWQICRHLRRL